MSVVITHNKDERQFFAEVDGARALLEYSVTVKGRTLDFQSTFVPPPLRGRHIAQDIVKFALEYAKENNYTIIPSCPFVKYYIDKHPEYLDITVRI